MALSVPVNSISQGLVFLVRADNFHGLSCANMAVDNVESIVHAGSGYVVIIPPFYPPDTSTQSKFFERLSHVARIPKKNSFIVARKIVIKPSQLQKLRKKDWLDQKESY